MRRLLLVLGLGAAGWKYRSWLCALFGCDTEMITIGSPNGGSTVSSPVTVTGFGRATQHNQLSVEVRDSSNAVIGAGTAAVIGALGQRGPFSATLSFTATGLGTPGHIQVFDSSPATGAVTHLASVLVTFA